jgi:hypothetical protein
MSAVRVLAHVLLLFVGSSALAAGTVRAGQDETAAVSSAPEPRWTLSFATTGVAFVPAAGVELAYQLNDRLAVGAQVGGFVFHDGQRFVVHNEINLRSRLYFISRPGWALYAGGNAHLWHAPVLSRGFAPAASGELGGELRWANGIRLGGGAGMAIYNGGCLCSHGPRGWYPLPVANIRVGKAW